MKAEGHALEMITLFPAMDPGQTLRFPTEKGVTKATSVITDNGSTGRTEKRYKIFCQVQMTGYIFGGSC